MRTGASGKAVFFLGCITRKRKKTMKRKKKRFDEREKRADRDEDVSGGGLRSRGYSAFTLIYKSIVLGIHRRNGPTTTGCFRSHRRSIIAIRAIIRARFCPVSRGANRASRMRSRGDESCQILVQLVAARRRERNALIGFTRATR